MRHAKTRVRMRQLRCQKRERVRAEARAKYSAKLKSGLKDGSFRPGTNTGLINCTLITKYRSTLISVMGNALDWTLGSSPCMCIFKVRALLACLRFV